MSLMSLKQLYTPSQNNNVLGQPATSSWLSKLQINPTTISERNYTTFGDFLTRDIFQLTQPSPA